MKRRRGLVPADTEIKDIDPRVWIQPSGASVSKEDIYEYLYFLNRECGNKKSSTPGGWPACTAFMITWSISQ